MVDFEVDMALVNVAGIVDIEEMVVEGMVVDIDTTRDTFAVVVGFHNHIPSNLVQVGFDIVVVAKPTMALVYSMNFEDIENFGGFFEGSVEHPWFPRSPWCHIVERIYSLHFFHLQLV